MVDFMILGAQKAATSALQASLRKHPLIYMPKGESPFFEYPDYTNSFWVNFGEDKPSEIKKGIKRPDYLCSDLAKHRIEAALPDCKFIVVLREPISRAISSYCYMVRHAHLASKPLNEGMRDCIADYIAGKDTRAASVISYGLYGTYLEKWIDIYGKDRFLILSQQEVGQELDNVIQLCLEHIGLVGSTNVTSLDRRTESNVGLYDPKLLRLARMASLIKTKPVPGSNRRIKRFIILRLVGMVLSKLVDFFARNVKQNKEFLDDYNKKKLAEIYYEDSKKLRGITDKSKFDWLN